MLKKLKEKAGNEILQVLIIVAVLGALAITITVLISSKLRSTAATQATNLGSGLGNAISEYSYNSSTSQALINAAAK